MIRKVTINGEKYIKQSEVDAMMEGLKSGIDFWYKEYCKLKATLPLQQVPLDLKIPDNLKETVEKYGHKENEFSSLNEQVQEDKPDMKDNVIELIKEDLECVHLYLDDKLTPRKDSYGKDYSIVGRIKFLEKYCYNPMIIKSDNICPTTNKPCDDECCPVGAICNLNNGHEFSAPQPEANDKPFVWEWNDDLVAEFYNWRIATGTGIYFDPISEFKKSKQSPTNNWFQKELDKMGITDKPQLPTNLQESKGWEIVSLKDTHYDKIVNSKNKLPFYSFEDYFTKYPKGRFEIHSVKRLSDGEVFSIGETVSTNRNRGQHKIDAFKIIDGDMCVEMATFPTGNEFLYAISKLPTPNTDTISSKPVFITDDGVEIDADYKGGGIWRVFTGLHSYPSWTPINLGIPVERHDDEKYFSTKEAAEQYIDLHKPKYSLQIVLDKINGYVPYDIWYIIKEKLKQ